MDYERLVLGGGGGGHLYYQEKSWGVGGGGSLGHAQSLSLRDLYCNPEMCVLACSHTHTKLFESIALCVFELLSSPSSRTTRRFRFFFRLFVFLSVV